MRRKLGSFIFLWLALSCAGLLGQDKGADKNPQAKTVDQQPAMVDQQPATVQPASHTRLRFGGFSVGGHYSSSPYWYPYWYPYYYPFSYAASIGWSPYWWGPYSSYYPMPYWVDSSTGGGKVKIDCAQDDAELLIDGAYAGFLKDLKNISLAPGAYNLQIRVPGKSPYEKRVYVLTGKTVSVTPEFKPLPEVTR